MHFRKLKWNYSKDGKIGALKILDYFSPKINRSITRFAETSKQVFSAYKIKKATQKSEFRTCGILIWYLNNVWIARRWRKSFWGKFQFILTLKTVLKGFWQDPSVQNAVTSNQTAKVDLEDYNPFDGKTTTNQNSAVMSATEEPPSSVTVQPSQAPPSQVSTADFQVRPVCHLW